MSRSGPGVSDSDVSRRWRSLAEDAAAAVPTGDPFHVRSSALPAIKARQSRLKEKMLARGDRLGELVAAGIDSQFVGDRLISKSQLSSEQTAELRALAPGGEAELLGELGQAFDDLRVVLAKADPLVTTAQISYNHTILLDGTYDEPTSEKSEVAVEIVASLVASQSSTSDGIDPSSSAIQQVEDLLAAIRDLQQWLFVLQA